MQGVTKPLTAVESEKALQAALAKVPDGIRPLPARFRFPDDRVLNSTLEHGVKPRRRGPLEIETSPGDTSPN